MYLLCRFTWDLSINYGPSADYTTSPKAQVMCQALMVNSRPMRPRNNHVYKGLYMLRSSH